MTEKNTNKKTKTDSDTDSKALGHGRQGGMTNCSINESFLQNLIKTRDHYCSYIRRDLSPSGAPMKCCPAGTSFASFFFQPGTQCSLILYFIPSSISPLPSSLFSSMLYEAQPMDGSRSALGAGIICTNINLENKVFFSIKKKSFAKIFGLDITSI